MIIVLVVSKLAQNFVTRWWKYLKTTLRYVDTAIQNIYSSKASYYDGYRYTKYYCFESSDKKMPKC